MNRFEVESRIGKKHWKEFEQFMKGQTVGVNKDRSIDYYLQDVEAFERMA